MRNVAAHDYVWVQDIADARGSDTHSPQLIEPDETTAYISRQLLGESVHIALMKCIEILANKAPPYTE